MNLRHTLLIAKYSARYSVRGGIGLVFLLLALTFGLLVAHIMLQPVEMIGKQTRGMPGGQPSTEQVLAELTKQAKPPVAWVLSERSVGAPDPAVRRAADAWAGYLLDQRPALLSAIFLILLFGWPLVVSFGAFDLYSGDIGSRQLRYQLLRANRSSIFVGRLLGMVMTFVAVLALLGVTVTGYIGLKLSVYPWVDLVTWTLYGMAAMLCVSVPYIALCAWISASCRSSFASLTFATLVIGGVPLLAMLGRQSHEAANYLLYLLPWGFQTRLFHPDATQVALAVAGCVLQTALFFWLGHRKFTTRGPVMTEPALRIDHLTKRFDKNVAVDDVSFDVPVGSIFGLLGPNGAGKTTLFSIAAGFLAADSGTLRVLGTDIAHIAELQGRMTILPQDASFQKNVPILEQLVFLRLLDGSDYATAEREVTEALEMVGIAEYKKRGIHALSHGMLKRMGIAQAFLGKPEVILLDEPTSGLDPQNARQIRDLVRDLQQSRQVTTIISSHNLAEIQELCDHVAILDKGKLKVAGPVAEITREGRLIELETARPLADAERARLLALAGVREIVERGPRRYRIMLSVPPDRSADEVVILTMRTVLDMGIAPRAMTEGNSLEEFFLSVTGPAAERAS